VKKIIASIVCEVNNEAVFW